MTSGLALMVDIPLGVVTGRAPTGNTDSQEPGRAPSGLVFGNVAAGVVYGATVFDSLRVAGEFKIYAPSSTGREAEAPALSLLAALRSYETQLFVPHTLSFRLRGHVEYSVSILTLGAEVGLVPALSLMKEKEGFFMLLSEMPLDMRAEKDYYPVGGCGMNIAWPCW